MSNDYIKTIYNNLSKHKSENIKFRTKYELSLNYIELMSKDELKNLKKHINKLLRLKRYGKFGSFINDYEKPIIIFCTVISTVIAVIALLF